MTRAEQVPDRSETVPRSRLVSDRETKERIDGPRSERDATVMRSSGDLHPENQGCLAGGVQAILLPELKFASNKDVPEPGSGSLLRVAAKRLGNFEGHREVLVQAIDQLVVKDGCSLVTFVLEIPADLKPDTALVDCLRPHPEYRFVCVDSADERNAGHQSEDDRQKVVTDQRGASSSPNT